MLLNKWVQRMGVLPPPALHVLLPPPVQGRRRAVQLPVSLAGLVQPVLQLQALLGLLVPHHAHAALG